ncbi:hypothetical protein GCM10009749_25110 [Agromyces neolithicus]|uniref:Uncharacterized protein n=1 Tax=Agromyces neolithicus TaxID=269420 RepID=A0ABN2M9L0_9MICO
MLLPSGIGRQRDGLQALGERQTEAIGERELGSLGPEFGRTFGIIEPDRLDRERVAEQQPSRQLPISAGAAYLLRHLRPIGGAARAAFVQALAHE